MNAPRRMIAARIPPKEHVVAILVRHREIREDDQKDEEVIDAERPLDEVSRDELGTAFGPGKDEHAGGENKGKTYPNAHPGR